MRSKGELISFDQKLQFVIFRYWQTIILHRKELELLRQKRREVQGRQVELSFSLESIFNKRNNQVAINRDNRKSLENAIDMQLQLLQVVEHTLNIESRCKFQQLGQSSVRMYEASTWKKWPSSNHSGGAGQAELAGGARSHGHHGRLRPRHTGTLTQQYIS